MASINIQTITMGEGTYRMVGYQAEGAHRLRVRFEMLSDGRLIDVILEQHEMDLLNDFRKEFGLTRLTAKGG